LLVVLNTSKAPRVSPEKPQPLSAVEAPKPTASVTVVAPPQPTPAAVATPTPEPETDPAAHTRFRNVAAVKRAFAAKQIDETELSEALRELDAARVYRLEQEQLKLQSGAIDARGYQRNVNAIDAELGY
jgi:hypothetical protein